MYLHEVASDSYVLLQAKLAVGKARELVEQVDMTYVIVHRSEPTDFYYLYTKAEAIGCLANHDAQKTLFDAFNLHDSTAPPTSDAFAAADEVADRAVVMEAGRVVGFFDATAAPTERGTKRGVGLAKIVSMHNKSFPNNLLQDIYETRLVTDGSGNRYQLRDHIDPEEGNLLHSLLIQHKFTNTLEIGCAFGISSLWICDALSHQISPHHTIIDPFQEADGYGVGVANLEKAGFHFFELIEKRSEIVLPSFLAEGKSFQFAFIEVGILLITLFLISFTLIDYLRMVVS